MARYTTELPELSRPPGGPFSSQKLRIASRTPEQRSQGERDTSFTCMPPSPPIHIKDFPSWISRARLALLFAIHSAELTLSLTLKPVGESLCSSGASPNSFRRLADIMVGSSTSRHWWFIL